MSWEHLLLALSVIWTPHIYTECHVNSSFLSNSVPHPLHAPPLTCSTPYMRHPLHAPPLTCSTPYMPHPLHAPPLSLVPPPYYFLFCQQVTAAGKRLTACLVSVFSQPSLACSVSQDTLVQVETDVMGYLVDDRLLVLEEVAQLNRSFNFLMLHVVDNSDKTAVFG